MPRVPRLQVQGASYLITCQGNAATPIFTNLADYETYLQLVAQYKQRYAFKLFAYCLMPNAAWLYLEPAPGTTLSAIMHDITTGYTRSVNKRYGRRGHLFQDRFKAIAVETPEAMVPVTAYLHRLPVRRGLAPKVEAYPFSSFPLYQLGDTVPDLLRMAPDIQQVLHALPGENSPEAYASALQQFSDEQAIHLEQQMKHACIGSAPFVEMARRRLSRAPQLSGGPAEACAPVVPDAARASKPPARPGVTAGTAAVVVLACLMVSLSQRIDGLKQMVMSLAQENEASFRSHASLTIQNGTLTGLTSLEGTAWDVRLAPLMGGASAALEQDQLVFLNNRVSSTRLSAQGIVNAPYHLSTLPDGTVGWESMQADAQGALITWQGSWHGTTMRGTITQQLPGEPARQFTFVGVSKTAAEPRSEI